MIKDTKSLASAVPGYKSSIIKKYNDWSKDHSLENYLPDAVKGYLPWLNRTNQTETAETTQTNQVAQASPPVVNSTTPNTSTASPETTKPSVDESQGKGLDLNADQIGDFVNAAWKGVRSMGLWARAKIENMASIFGMLAGFALVPVYVFYFLSEKSGIKDNWTRYLPVHESWIKDEIVFVLRSINDALIVFFRGQVLVAMCVGGLLMIGFSIIKLKYAVLLGFIAGVLGIVPYLGVMLSIVPAMAISIVQSDSWLHPAGTLGIFILVQMAEGLVISPKIIGDRVGMHPLTVIIAIMIGTTLMGGIIGGVLAIPLTAALRTLMFRYVWKQPVGENQPAMAEKPAEG